MKWSYLILLLAVLAMGTKAHAQLSTLEENQLQEAQDSLVKLSYKMVNGYTHELQLQAVNQFIPQFVEALKIKNSFSFPFDSLKQLSILYDKEHTFRIITWAIALSDFHYRFYGVIQKNTADGNLKIYPLFDNAFFNKNKDTIVGPKNWIGALYYKLIEKKYQNKKYYTLIGWAGKDISINTKVVDVLTFQNGKPVFGAPVFSFTKDTIRLNNRNRFFYVYKKDGDASINYDSELDLIIFDHLTSINGKPKDTATLVPDGTYSGFKWEHGSWMYLPKIFHQSRSEPPIPKPLKNKSLFEGDDRNKKK